MPIVPSRGRRIRVRDAPRDWWDKAAIVSGFASSVVIALIGILISYSIQRAQLISAEKSSEAQIEIAKLKAQDDKRLQEGQLTAQLVQHLISEDEAQREIAVVALRESVPPDVCDKIIAILARGDASPVVRARAIEELGMSSTANAAKALPDISFDPDKPPLERSLAASSSVQVAARQVVDDTSRSGATLLLASAGARELALDTGPFTRTLLRGMAGDADANGDGTVMGSELGRYVVTKVPAAMGPFDRTRQRPIWAMRGGEDVVIGPATALQNRYRQALAVVVGVSTSSAFDLPGVRADVQRVTDAMRQAGITTTVFADRAATKDAVLTELRRATSSLTVGDLFIFYLAGTGVTGRDGVVRWWLTGGERDSLTVSDLNAALDRIPARSKVVIIDSCHAGAIAE